MPIARIEELVFAVENPELCARYCTDFGLTPETGATPATFFSTAVGQRISLHPFDAPGIPAGVNNKSGVREIVWGVTEPDDIQRIAERLSATRPVTFDDQGGLHSHDETGFGIAFRLARPVAAEGANRQHNIFGHTERRNERLGIYGRAKPRRIIHIALDLPKEEHEAAQRFYIETLGFKPVETIKPTGVFLQCEMEDDHHQLFLCHRTDTAGTNHAAFEVRDFDEVVEGGNYMVAQGWKEARRLGRHTVGSNVFRFVASPLGGRFEYASDMDKVDKTIPPKIWQTSPDHHLWMIKTNADD